MDTCWKNISLNALDPILDNYYCPLCRVQLYLHNSITALPDTLIEPSSAVNRCYICHKYVSGWFIGPEEDVTNAWIKILNFINPRVKRREDRVTFIDYKCYLQFNQNKDT